MISIIKKFIFLFLFLMLSVSTQAADHCIRDGGSGDGSAWNNAWDDLPATLTRGDTYYVADGTYSSYSFNDAESGSSVITIKKAIIADHGTETGWDNAYGDGYALIGPFYFTTGYYTIDGQVGGGPTSWQSGHGFKITANYTNLIRFNAAVSDVSFSHIEMYYATSEVGDEDAADHIYSVYVVTNFTLAYCYLHDTSRTFLLTRYWQNILVEYNYFARNRSTAGKHSEGWSDNGSDTVIIRFNVWEDIEGTGCVVMLYSDAYNWEIYGNIVYWTGNPNYGGFGGNGCFTTRTTEAYGYDWKIYNNTVIDGKGINTFHVIWSGSGSLIKNNLWYNSPVTAGGTGTIDYNWYILSGDNDIGANDVSDLAGPDPFVDLANENFHLNAASFAGLDVTVAGKSFHLDIDGLTRGDDGVWEIGAYEFTGAAAPSGTLVVAGGIVESEVKDGGKTLVLTLDGTTWDADIANVGAVSVALIAGLDSNKAEGGGWDAVVKAGLAFGDVTRNSDTVVTILLPAFAAYQITESETIEVTIDSTCVASATQIVASPTFIVSVDTLPDVSGVGAHIVAGGLAATLTTGGVKITSP